MSQQKVSIQVTVTVNPAAPPPPPPLVALPNTIALPDETVGTALPLTPVSQISGGTPPYDYAPTGDLPPGVEFAQDGTGAISLIGTPQAAGSFSFGIDVVDSGT